MAFTGRARVESLCKNVRGPGERVGLSPWRVLVLAYMRTSFQIGIDSRVQWRNRRRFYHDCSTRGVMAGGVGEEGVGRLHQATVLGVFSGC